VGPSHREIDAADFDIAGILSLGERVCQAFARLCQIINFALFYTGRLSDADSQDFDGGAGLNLADDEASFAGADFESDVNFSLMRHDFVLWRWFVEEWIGGVLAGSGSKSRRPVHPQFRIKR
jgi:hypothetical protein